ncbi:hypothetical protein LINPERPRIM_LOCUS32614, partial [Linum perenne]
GYCPSSLRGRGPSSGDGANGDWSQGIFFFLTPPSPPCIYINFSQVFLWIWLQLLGTAGALLSADRAHRAEQPQGSEELEKQLRESRAAAQQWKAKCSKAKKEMDEESARLLEEKEKRYKVEGALTAAETEQKALKEKVALLEASKAEMAKALEDKTKSLKETAETLQTLKADV